MYNVDIRRLIVNGAQIRVNGCFLKKSIFNCFLNTYIIDFQCFKNNINNVNTNYF